MKLLVASIVGMIAITVFSLTSCSPEPHATLKEALHAAAPTAGDHNAGTAEIADPMSGDWICAPKNKCSYAEISISEKDSSAQVKSDPSKDSVSMTIEGNFRLNPENNGEILFKGEHYIRKPAPSPSAV